MVFIGGGAGMAPMRSHLFDQLKALETDRKISFWYGARSLCERCSTSKTTTGWTPRTRILSGTWRCRIPQPEDNWDGLTGFHSQRAL